MAYVIYAAYVLYIRDIRNIKNIYCRGGPSVRGKRQENRRDGRNFRPENHWAIGFEWDFWGHGNGKDGSLGGWRLLFQGGGVGARANVGVLGGLWMLLTGVENFLCEKMFFGSFF